MNSSNLVVSTNTLTMTSNKNQRVISPSSRPRRVKMSDDEWQVLRQVIYTTADMEYVQSLIFSEDVVRKAVAAFRGGVGIVTDTVMTRAGINKFRLSSFGGVLSCYVNDPEVIEQAKEEGINRTIAAMRKAISDPNNRIFVIGNMPAAIFELLRLIELGKTWPALIVGLPVGLNKAVAKSKEDLTDIAANKISSPFITNVGGKGGPSVAAAIINALLNIAYSGH